MKLGGDRDLKLLPLGVACVGNLGSISDGTDSQGSSLLDGGLLKNGTVTNWWGAAALNEHDQQQNLSSEQGQGKGG